MDTLWSVAILAGVLTGVLFGVEWQVCYVVTCSQSPTNKSCRETSCYVASATPAAGRCKRGKRWQRQPTRTQMRTAVLTHVHDMTHTHLRTCVLKRLHDTG